MRFALKMLFCLSVSPFLFAQLTPAQKANELQQLAALFSKRYAFYEWKQDIMKFDGLALAPWMERVSTSKDDLDFLEICAEYVASYQDSHTTFVLPSTFRASLGLGADIYEGKVLIDSINRKILPEKDYPFQIGDEVVSLDSKPVAELIAYFARFAGEGNPVARQRTATAMLFSRVQAYVPRAHEIGDYASLVVRRADGTQQTYTLTWIKSGTPYLSAGPVPDPILKVRPALTTAALKNLRESGTYRLRQERWVNGMGALAPIFAMPSTFTQRLGKSASDSFYSGVFNYQGKAIGYLRVPSFEYFSATQLRNEIRYFKQAADGLIVDVMRNPGGYACATEDLISYFMPYGFHSAGASWRVTWSDIMSVESELESAAYYGATDEEIAKLEHILRSLKRAYADNRGMTGALPLCGLTLDPGPAVDPSGNVLTFDKPMMVLVDQYSASAAELFAAIMQDEKRALIYGARTIGAGGSVQSTDVGFYMEGTAYLARTIAVRKFPVIAEGFPEMPFIENIGVRPDREAEYMTVDNLTNKGKAFVEGFLAAMLEHISK